VTSRPGWRWWPATPGPGGSTSGAAGPTRARSTTRRRPTRERSSCSATATSGRSERELEKHGAVDRVVPVRGDGGEAEGSIERERADHRGNRVETHALV